LPIRRRSCFQVGKILAYQAIAGEQNFVIGHPNRKIGCRVPRRKQDFGRAAPEVELGVAIYRPIGVDQVCSMKKGSRFTARTASRVGDGIVELGDFGLEFIECSRDPNVAPHVDPAPAKNPVSTNVIKVLLGIDDAQLVSWPRGGGVSVYGLSG